MLENEPDRVAMDAPDQHDPVGEPMATEPGEAVTTRRTRRRVSRSATSEEPAGAPEPGELSGAKAPETAVVVSEGDVSGEAPTAARQRRRRKATAGDEIKESAVSAPQAPSGTRSRGKTTTAAPAESAPSPAASETGAVTPKPAVSDDLASEAAAPEPTSERPERPERKTRVRRGVVATTPLFMAPTGQEPEPTVERTEAEPAADRAAQEEPAEPVTETAGRTRRRRSRRAAEEPAPRPTVVVEEPDVEEEPESSDLYPEDELDEAGRRRRRRGRRGRGRGKGVGGEDFDEDEQPAAARTLEEEDTAEEVAVSLSEDEEGEALTRRRRRRRRKGAVDAEAGVESPNVVVRIREPRGSKDEVQSVTGSTRLEAKRQRRRDGREQRRTRPAILSESEFLARREAVDRVMVVRQRSDRTQIAVLEDGVLVEHYVARASASTMVGNVYLGRVQNVLPSMEAAFIDLGRGRNAVLYAGEVNWNATGLEGRTRTIEQALKSGDSVLVQVTKDPIGTKGARLTSHVALSGRHLVFVPNGNASGISRKLSDVERKRLRDILKNLVPDGAGVIVRTAAEGASEEELARDVTRLQAQWEDIQKKATSGNAPSLLYEEPDLVIRVVRDLFNEDFRELVVQGPSEYDLIESYLGHVSPDLVTRLRRYTGAGDVFADLRVDEQILKGLDRKVYLPSGGSLVIDRTEAMTVIDVNTGKYTGAGGNLEETVTRNNLEAAEEIVRQLRLRDLGGIIVIDFIDMVLESNRELVLRRLTECLGRDRTKHQVTEITSLGLVQMTRKRVGQGLLEAFSETCEVCKGRGLIMHTEPVPDRRSGGQDRAGVAKVAAATVTAGAGDAGESADTTESPKTSRRRARKAAADAANEAAKQAARSNGVAGDASAVVANTSPVGEVGDAVLSPADLGASPESDPTAPDAGDELVADEAREFASSEADLDEVGVEEELAAAGGRRRTRRTGARRRTRP